MTDDLVAEGKRIAEERAEARRSLYVIPEIEPEPPEPPEPPDDQGNDQDERTIPVLADKLLTRSALRDLPDPEPLIDNVLDQGTTALLYGKWGTAKTFIALDWAACVATGRAWQDRPTVQRRVLYVVGEGAFGFKGRVDAWEVGWQTQVRDDDLHILPVPVNLTNTADLNNLRALVFWGGYSLVVLDTLARCMVGADENSAKDCGIVVDAMTKLLASTPGGRGVVLGVHHAGKDGKTLRGSSAFEAAADTVYFTERDGGVITLDRQKRKDGPETDSHQLEIDPMPGTSSAVISRARSAPPQGGATDRAEQLYSIFLQAFSGTGATSAQVRTVAMEAGMSNGSVYRALNDLVEDRRLVNTGTSGRPFYKQAS
jgi:AAA domain